MTTSTEEAELVRYHLDAGVDVAHVLLDHGADPCLRSELDELAPAEAAQREGMT